MKRNTTAPYSNRPFKKPRQVTVQTAVRQEVKRQIARTMDVKQCFGRDTAPVGAAATGYILDLMTPLSRGDGGTNNFEGSKIIPKSLKIRYQVGATDINNLVRVILFQWDKDSVGAAPVPIDILTAAALGTSLAPLSARHWPPVHYTILYDKLIQMQNNAGFSGGLGTTVAREIFIPGSKLKPIYFDPNSYTQTQGAIYMLYVSDSLAIGHPTVLTGWDMPFTD